MNKEPTLDEMLEEAERREAENKALEALDKLYDENSEGMKQLAEHERIKVIQTACGAIGKCTEELKKLDETEKVELRAELEAKKKENFQLVADACMENYKKKYEELPIEDEYWRFLVSDYCATGEGRTIRILCTQANLSEKEDFGNEPYDYTPRTSKEYRAVREFHKYFGTWSLYGVEFLSREDFFEKYANCLPPVFVNLKDKQCFLAYHGELHYNFS